MLHQIAYAAFSLGAIVALALPVGAANHQGCDDYANPLCVPFGAAEERQEGGMAQRGSGR